MDEIVDIDTDTFIIEMQKYPCIWNYKCESYSNKVERNIAWTNIYKRFTRDFDEKSAKEQNRIARALHRKWKTLRDGFNRELKKSKSTNNSKKQYTFFHQLSFLMPLAEARAETSNGIAGFEPFSQDSEEEDHKPLRIRLGKLKRKSRRSFGSKHHTSDMDMDMETVSRSVDDVDDDKYFLLSLHKDFKSIPEEFKLDAKAEIIGVLKKFKATSSNSVL